MDNCLTGIIWPIPGMRGISNNLLYSVVTLAFYFGHPLGAEECRQGISTPGGDLQVVILRRPLS